MARDDTRSAGTAREGTRAACGVGLRGAAAARTPARGAATWYGRV
jgi:hypothetical protein